MAHDVHHEHLVKELTEQLSPVFSNSPQGIYLYLDDEHKSCNEKFAEMLGYTSVDEWVKNEYPVGDIVEEDQEKVIHAYGHASQEFQASTLSVSVMTKKGKKIEVDVIMVPLTYKDEVFVLHFISKK